MGNYNVTIGLEMHCEGDKTNSKVFSSARNGYSSEANVNVSPVDLAFPGILPVLNVEAVKQSIMMSLILNCKVPKYMYFERKNYYYPDLPKGYQITQNPPFDCVGMNGYLDIIRDDGSTFRVGIDNFHLEEDAASLDHYDNYSAIDYNRAGVPLFELVTTPSLHSADDAIYFLEYVRSIYQYCGISSADSKKGQLRCDVNVSISKDDKLGTKVEMKNVNSFRGVHDCIEYEIKRQSELMDQGRYDEVVQETRRWDEESGTTKSMRLKADAEDYKYFVEPNIPKFELDPKWIEDIKNSIPMLAYERKDMYISKYGLSNYDASIIVKDVKLANYFEECINLGVEPKSASNWLNTQILGYLSKIDKDIEEIYLTPKRLKVILDNISSGNISSKQGKELFNLVLERCEEPEVIIKSEGMVQLSDDNAIISVIDEVLSENPSQIEAYHNGKTNMFDYFVGQVMKKTKGQANPVKVKEILNSKLN